jgi:hypothetical protein
MKRACLFVLCLLATSLVLTGCPGELRDPEQYAELPACRGDIDVPALFAEKCGSSICHGGQSSAPAAMLDLTSEGVAARLVNVPAEECEGLVRIDPHDPDNSFLLGKLIEPPAGCGDRMPLVGLLSANEIACVRTWIHTIAAQELPDASVPADAADLDAGNDGGGG